MRPAWCQPLVVPAAALELHVRKQSPEAVLFGDGAGAVLLPRLSQVSDAYPMHVN